MACVEENVAAEKSKALTIEKIT